MATRGKFARVCVEMNLKPLKPKFILEEKVHSASNYVKFETPNKPDFVLAFLENHGFSKTQISNLARKYPPVILCDLEKTLLTKFWFFKSKSVSSTDVAKILSLAPAVLKRSMENQIIPPFNFFKSFVQSEEETIPAIKRNADLLLVDLQACALPNVKILREANVPDAKILFMLKFKAGAFNSTSDRFRKIVNKVTARVKEVSLERRVFAPSIL
ncbi:hypothetical protein ACSBR1_023348 [Camellia fascicularis]